MKRCQFASDNYSGVCPEALEAMIAANEGCDYAYGNDRWTTEACDLFRNLFETDCEIFFVFNGTAANSLSLASLCQSYHSIICHELAHVEKDECGAPEFYSNGAKLLVAKGENGKLNPNSIEDLVTRRSDIHYPKPKAISITQATELGTVYTPDDLLAIREVTQRRNLKIHMDGARLVNAAAALDLPLKELTWKCGVDVLSMGGTKNGLAFGDAVIFFNKDLAEDFAWRCKQAGQLASKMRFLSSQWVGILKEGIWLKHARHANRCAQLLRDKLEAIPNLEFMSPTEANSVFVRLPQRVYDSLSERGWHYHNYIGAGGARLMCSWATTEQDVNDLAHDLAEEMKFEK